MAYQELKKRYGQKLNVDAITKLIICEIYKHASKDSADTAGHWLSKWSAVNLGVLNASPSSSENKTYVRARKIIPSF